MSLKRVPLSSFLIFATENVNKTQKIPPFTFFGTMRHFLKEKIKKFKFFFKKSLLRFLSLRYSADFRRSRLVLYCCRGNTEKIIDLPSFDEEHLSSALNLASSFAENEAEARAAALHCTRSTVSQEKTKMVSPKLTIFTAMLCRQNLLVCFFL